MKILEILKIIKILFVILLIGGIGFLGYQLYKNYKDKNRLYSELIGQKEKYKQINKYLAQLEVSYTDTTELLKQQKLKFNEIEIKKNEKIQSLSNNITKLKNKVRTLKESDVIWNSKDGKRGYLFNEVRLNGNDSPPIGWVMIKKNGEIKTGNYRFEIRSDLLQIKDNNTGRVKIFSKVFWIARQNGVANRSDNNLKKWKNIDYELPIQSGQVLIDPTMPNLNKNEWSLWNPKFSLGFNIGIDNDGLLFKPSLSFNFLNYGKIEQPQIKFLSIGIGLDKNIKKIDLHLKPISYSPFLLLKNTYFYPFVGINLKNNKNFGIGVELGF